MVYTLNAVVSYTHFFEDFQFTYNLASGMTIADEGKAMTLDSAGPNRMKLAGDGDSIMGRLEKFEDRSLTGGGLVGTVSRKFKAKLPKSGTVAIGQTVEGAAGGAAKASATFNPIINTVIEVGSDFVVVEKL